MKRGNKPDLNRLGMTIRRLRKAHGYNQTELATRAGTRTTTISELENGLNPNPGWDLIDRISKVLHTTIHQLTLPDSSTMADDRNTVIPAGLSKLLKDQELFLGASENRINLREVEWLKRLPFDDPETVTPEEFLHILRHMRLIKVIREKTQP